MHRRITGRLVIATHNPGKLAEMRELLAPYGIEALSIMRIEKGHVAGGELALLLEHERRCVGRHRVAFAQMELRQRACDRRGQPDADHLAAG